MTAGAGVILDADRAFFSALRSREYSRLEREGDAYLDWTGAALHPESLPSRHADELCRELLGNPHSENPSSRASSDVIRRARHEVLRFVDGDPDEYGVIFTANASGALRLVGEAFPFSSSSRFVLCADNHNSVNGIREFALRRGAAVVTVPIDDELRMSSSWDVPRCAPGEHSLFAYPAQSNFSGVRHPLAFVRRARAMGFKVLLDAAALLATGSLSLRRVPADFVALSFYKIFGYPTGIGALVARRDALAVLERPWFAGGTVDFASSRHMIRRLLDAPEAFEDGTPHFQGIGAIRAGLEAYREVGSERVGRWCAHLTARALARLTNVRRPDGGPGVKIYGSTSGEARGAAIALNVLHGVGEVVPYDRVVAAASRRRIHLRGGCFCNPGASEQALAFPDGASRRCLESMSHGPFSPTLFSACLGGHPVGAVRASFGPATSEADVDRLCDLVEDIADAKGGDGADSARVASSTADG